MGALGLAGFSKKKLFYILVILSKRSGANSLNDLIDFHNPKITVDFNKFKTVFSICKFDTS